MSDFNQLVVESAAKQFTLEGDIISVQPFGSGHINDTYRVVTTVDSGISHLLQRINHHVFPNVDGLMHNIEIVTKHLSKKVKVAEGKRISDHVLTIVPTKGGELYIKDSQDNYWRMFILIEDTKSYDIVETEVQAAEGGRAFGLFQKQLSDLDASLIVEVLPNFHNIEFRLENLRKAIAKDVCQRVASVKDKLDFIFSREDRMKTILELGNKGELPLRITHNDTKFNNVLLDRHDKMQCVIDLDTVMPGYVAYDFGDAIRTIINPVAEDEMDVSKILLNLALYKAYAEGYLEEANDFLTTLEKETLVDGAFLLPYMQGVRFLTDYLEGDHYYKTKYDDHNLVRTNTQLKLVEEMEKNEAFLRKVVFDCI
ncbi:MULTISPECIES: phosphotransferase enzyme family protein [Sphingobacterium]|uniref:phosphotransferase enzyme family protein n=1 Tax=Sphingobacterium TaxID=28453 RepID=UPI000E823A51|nr:MULTISPECIES: aminoglycoside phosphotransferase family protein [Sphingobacterium]HAF34414.1 desulfatase [Sphingobacterium sp.]HAT91055.1 desulfatase [Sphingobacterium sp.]HAU51720.1 desulfatase [Sphingobacterium sp.]